MATSSQPSERPFLMDLPTELVDKVVANSTLTSTDRKNLRLTHRFFKYSQGAILFRRIYLSHLRQDLEAFEGITSTPYLADFVKEIVFLEVPDLLYYNHAFRTNKTDLSPTEEQLVLSGQLAESFYGGNAASWESSGFPKPPRIAVSIYCERFNLMPNVIALISEPIEICRLLAVGANLKDASARAQEDCSVLIDEATLGGHSWPSDGLLQVFPSALSQSRQKISSLTCRKLGMNASIDTNHDPSLLRRIGSKNFVNLTSINLEFVAGWVPEDIAECLAAATGLQQLVISNEPRKAGDDDDNGGGNVRSDKLFFSCLFPTGSHWEYLTSMRIANLTMEEREIEDFSRLHN
ncbi:hypothetical protein LX32DRAFT_647111, partial [Colletotrichum zoysiae]